MAALPGTISTARWRIHVFRQPETARDQYMLIDLELRQ
jgi:hypothetical protein